MSLTPEINEELAAEIRIPQSVLIVRNMPVLGLGNIGYEGRYHYGAIGSVLNLASRLCDHAAADQILITNRIYAKVESVVKVEDIGALDLKGFHKPISTFNLMTLTDNGTGNGAGEYI